MVVGKEKPLKSDPPGQHYSNVHSKSPYFFGLRLALRGLNLLRLQSKRYLIFRG